MRSASNDVTKDSGYALIMNLRYVLSAVGLGVAALILAGLALRTLVRSGDGTVANDPRMLAYSRFSAAIGCATLAASYMVPDGLATVLLLLAAVAGLVTSIALKSVRRRRMAEKPSEH